MLCRCWEYFKEIKVVAKCPREALYSFGAICRFPQDFCRVSGVITKCAPTCTSTPCISTCSLYYPAFQLRNFEGFCQPPTVRTPQWCIRWLWCRLQNTTVDFRIIFRYNIQSHDCTMASLFQAHSNLVGCFATP